MRTQSRCAGFPFQELVSSGRVSGSLQRQQVSGGGMIQEILRGGAVIVPESKGGPRAL